MKLVPQQKIWTKPSLLSCSLCILREDMIQGLMGIPSRQWRNSSNRWWLSQFASSSYPSVHHFSKACQGPEPSLAPYLCTAKWSQSEFNTSLLKASKDTTSWAAVLIFSPWLPVVWILVLFDLDMTVQSYSSPLPELCSHLVGEGVVVLIVILLLQ